MKTITISRFHNEFIDISHVSCPDTISGNASTDMRYFREESQDKVKVDTASFITLFHSL